MEEQLASALGEGEMAEFAEDDEFEAGEMIGDPSLSPCAGLGLERVDEINGGEEPSAQSGPDASRAMAIARWVLRSLFRRPARRYAAGRGKRPTRGRGPEPR